MAKWPAVLLLILPFLHVSWGAANPTDDIGLMLDDFHLAAAAADGPRYFGHFTSDAVFIGTAAEERWDLDGFRAFCEPYFEEGQGWTYVPRERRITLGPDGSMAWFDELVNNEKYGLCRGTGVVRRDGDAWRIAQYGLSFPIPNEIAPRVTELVRAYEDDELEPITVYVVRHAEKDTGEADPELNAQGRDRADRLARTLRDVGIEGAYATEYKRTQQTVAPVATAAGLDVTVIGAADLRVLAEEIQERYGATVVVAGHSNTVPGLMRLLGVEHDITLTESDYDDLFIVTVDVDGAAHMTRLHY